MCRTAHTPIQACYPWRVTIGERIRDLRLKKNMTPTQLASAAGMTDSAIHQLEDGRSKAPSFQNGVRLARALGVSPEELAFGKTRPGDAPISIEDRLSALERDMAALKRQKG